MKVKSDSSLRSYHANTDNFQIFLTSSCSENHHGDSLYPLHDDVTRNRARSNADLVHASYARLIEKIKLVEDEKKKLLKIVEMQKTQIQEMQESMYQLQKLKEQSENQCEELQKQLQILSSKLNDVSVDDVTVTSDTLKEAEKSEALLNQIFSKFLDFLDLKESQEEDTLNTTLGKSSDSPTPNQMKNLSMKKLSQPRMGLKMKNIRPLDVALGGRADLRTHEKSPKKLKEVMTSSETSMSDFQPNMVSENNGPENNELQMTSSPSTSSVEKVAEQSNTPSSDESLTKIKSVRRLPVANRSFRPIRRVTSSPSNQVLKDPMTPSKIPSKSIKKIISPPKCVTSNKLKNADDVTKSRCNSPAITSSLSKNRIPNRKTKKLRHPSTTSTRPSMTSRLQQPTMMRKK